MKVCDFSEKRKIRFAAYVTQLDQRKLENFLMRFEFASVPMDKNKIELLFHALICLFLRKVEKLQTLPKDEATKDFCEELSGHVFGYFDGGKEDKLRAKEMTIWIQRE